MKERRPVMTRKQRAARSNLKRIGVAIFLVLFFCSVVGVALVSYTTTTR